MIHWVVFLLLLFLNGKSWNIQQVSSSSLQWKKNSWSVTIHISSSSSSSSSGNHIWHIFNDDVLSLLNDDHDDDDDITTKWKFFFLVLLLQMAARVKLSSNTQANIGQLWSVEWILSKWNKKREKQEKSSILTTRETEKNN